MNRKLKIMLPIAGFTIVRSIYQLCVLIYLIIHMELKDQILSSIIILIIIFENYFVLSCLVKEKNPVLVEIELSFVCFYYIFSIGFAVVYFTSAKFTDFIITGIYILCIELYKIVYIKSLIKKDDEQEKLEDDHK